MPAVLYDVADRVATCTLNRPSAMNGIDEEILAGLAEVVAKVRADDSVRTLVITGAGDAFCVGLDIDLLGRAFGDSAYFRTVLERLKAILLDLEALPVPVIAAVNGLARAGGFEIALACDLVVVADEARIADHHMSFGIVPGGGATQRAPRKMGQQRARELIFTARWLRGPEAVEAGLALRSVPRAELDAAVEALTSQIRSRSRACLAATKAAMNEGAALPIGEAVDVEIAHFMEYLDGEPTSREGYQAYLEKREPVWP